MKRIVIVMVIAISAVGIASAQRGGWGMAGPNQPSAVQQAQPKAASIEGKLAFVDKVPAVQTKDKTYYLHFQGFYYYAYTDGIKEGDTLKLDGYELAALPGSDKPGFVVTKAVINGKTYDFTAPGNMMGRGSRGNFGMMGQQGPMGNYGPKGSYGPMMDDRFGGQGRR
jgi:hypothetical protein